MRWYLGVVINILKEVLRTFLFTVLFHHFCNRNMLEFLIEYGYLGMFVAAFLAATILPFSSELVLAALLSAGGDRFGLFLAATAGNSIGGVTNYMLGYYMSGDWLVRRFKIKRERLDSQLRWVKEKGAWLGILCWVPIIGDPLGIALGVARSNPYISIATMVVGKALRYMFLIYILMLID